MWYLQFGKECISLLFSNEAGFYLSKQLYFFLGLWRLPFLTCYLWDQRFFWWNHYHIFLSFPLEWDKQDLNLPFKLSKVHIFLQELIEGKRWCAQNMFWTYFKMKGVHGKTLFLSRNWCHAKRKKNFHSFPFLHQPKIFFLYSFR